MSKWTKGPWTLDTDDENASVRDLNGNLVVAGEYEGYSVPFDCRDDALEAKANDRLIAQAPVLAEELAKMIAEFGPIGGGDSFKSGLMVSAYNALDAAGWYDE